MDMCLRRLLVLFSVYAGVIRTGFCVRARVRAHVLKTLLFL